MELPNEQRRKYSIKAILLSSQFTVFIDTNYFKQIQSAILMNKPCILFDISKEAKIVFCFASKNLLKSSAIQKNYVTLTRVRNNGNAVPLG